MKNILVPTDFSETSEYALEVAAGIARTTNCSITLLHMMGLSESVLAKNETQEYEEAMYYMKLAKERFREFLDKPYLQGLGIYEVVQNYKIFSEISQVAREQQADLIVMGSHGTNGIGRLFVGSNTEKVVRSAEVPVLVVKERLQDFEIKNILFGCDYKEEAIPAFRKVKAFADEFSASIRPVYVNLPNERFRGSPEIEARFVDFMHKAGESHHPALTIFNDYSVEAGLFNYAKKEGMDIISLPTHGRKGLSHFFQGSVGESLANHANLPVLTVKL